MDNYYEIMHYLKTSKMDRQYPYDFKEGFTFENNNAVFPTVYPDYKGIDEVEAYFIFKSSDVDVANISLKFSPLLDGSVSLLSLSALPTEIIEDTVTTIRFGIDTNAKVTDISKLLTGVKSINIDLGENGQGTQIVDIVFRTFDYNYTLSDLDKAYLDGEDRVLRRLNELQSKETQRIPKELQRYVYMCAGAYAWLSTWENEAKPMKEPKSESNNYADRLFGQVDSALQKYLSTIENDPDKTYINMNLIGASKLDWGIHNGRHY